jgi:two-component system OmpR family response regulator
MKALLVASNTEIQTQLGAALRADRLTLQQSTGLQDALAICGKEQFSVVISDHHLADGSGTDLAQRFRQDDIDWPVMLLMNNGTEAEKIAALDVGVDEILAWPASSELVLAHVRSLIRRCRPSESSRLQVGDLQFDLRSLVVKRDAQRFVLTSREMAILEFLMRHPHRLITRSELVDAIWKANSAPESNVVDVFIGRLRNKIDKPFDKPYIHTVVGRGYMLSDSRPGV